MSTALRMHVDQHYDTYCNKCDADGHSDGALTQEPGEELTLEIQSNDPYMPTAQIPVQLMVTELPIVAMVLPTE